MSLLGDDKIIGNDALRSRLYTDIKEGTLAHAYIIEGKKGSGRHTLAKSIIAAMACESRQDSLPCGNCISCRHIFEDKCADVMMINKGDKASLGVDVIREMKLGLFAVPNDLDFKAYIIEDGDTMTDQAQNAFLLTLEQPPRFVSFFIICENARSLLETIRSRAPILRTEPVPPERIAEYICSDKAEKSVRDAATALKRSQPEEFETVLIAADGSIGRAIELLSPKARKPISDRRALVTDFIEALRINGKGEHILSILPRFPQKRDELNVLLEDIKLALRDMILLKKSENAPVCFYASKEKALDISSMFSTRKLMSVFELTEKAQDALSKNANVRLTLISLLCNL